MGGDLESWRVPEPVETSQQFFAWYGAIEAQIEQEQESAYRTYAQLLTQYGIIADQHRQH